MNLLKHADHHYYTRGRGLFGTLFRIVSCLLLAASFAACDDYDTFTTDASRTLRFSQDEIVFDTLITTIPSSTKTLTIYNRGDEGLRIRQVRLAQGSASPFRLNIDGQDLSRTAENMASDFEVRRRDSILVRIEVTVPEQGSDDPVSVTDQLLLTLESGVVQRVSLSVVGQDAFYLEHRTLTADTTLTARRPILVRDSLVVGPDVTMTMEAGTRLLFHDDAYLMVRGRIDAQGTLEEPVVLRGDRTDHIFDYLPYDRLPGRWQGVILAAESTDNKLNYVDLHGATYGIVCEAPSVAEALTEASPMKLTLTNSVITNIKGDGLAITDCRAEVSNTEISNTLGHCVNLLGGYSVFTHCTLAQFYPLDANRGDALHIANVSDGVYHPLYLGDFVNTVITGYADDVVMGEWADASVLPTDVSEGEAEYHFLYCFLATEIPTGDEFEGRFVGCVYDDPEGEYAHEKNFKLLDTHALLYDFMPQSYSSICKIANPAYSVKWPTDRSGHDRIADSTPDAGCYEWTE